MCSEVEGFIVAVVVAVNLLKYANARSTALNLMALEIQTTSV